MGNPFLSQRNILTAIAFDKAQEILSTLLRSEDPDELGDAMEAAASDSDLAEAVIFRLLVLAKGWEDNEDGVSGVEMVSRALEPQLSLWTP
jgi:hypothetical protein